MNNKELFNLLEDISDDIITETDKHRKTESVNACLSEKADLSDNSNTDDIRGEVLRKKKISWKNAVAAVTALTAVISGLMIFGSYFNGKTEKNNVSKSENSITSEQNAGDDNDEKTVESNETTGVKQYRTELLEKVYTYPVGSYDGNSIFLLQEEKYNSEICSFDGRFSGRKILNEKGQEFCIISDIVQFNDKILVYGSVDSRKCEICVYDNTLSNVLFSIYTEANEAVFSSTLSGDTIYYISCTDVFCLKSFNMKTSESREVRFEGDELDYGYVSCAGVLNSGNISVLARSSQPSWDLIPSTDLVIFDDELNLIKKENLNNDQMCSIVSYEDDHITAYYSQMTSTYEETTTLRYLYSDDDDNFSLINEDSISIDHRNSDNSISFIKSGLKGKYNVIYGNADTPGGNIYGFSSEGGESTDLTEYIKNGLSDNHAEIIQYFYLDGELCCVLNNITHEKRVCTDPYGDREICSIDIDYIPENYNSYCSDGILYLWIPVTTGTETSEYIIHEINLSTGNDTVSSFMSDINLHYPVFYADKNYYIAASVKSAKDDTDENSIYIFSHDGKLLETVKPENGYSIREIFRTSENDIIVTARKDFTSDPYSSKAYKLNAEDGTLEVIDEGEPYIYPAYHITGTNGYLMYYMYGESVYGVKETDSGKVSEKIAEFDDLKENPNFSTDEMNRFSYNEKEDVWYLYYKANLHRAVAK